MTYLENLHAMTDRALANIDAHLADCDPFIYLAGVKMHLADRSMEPGDVQAWYLLHDIQECLFRETTTPCVRCNCRQMEGLHPDKLVRPCAGFVSMEDSYQAALRTSAYAGVNQ